MEKIRIKKILEDFERISRSEWYNVKEGTIVSVFTKQNIFINSKRLRRVDIVKITFSDNTSIPIDNIYALFKKKTELTMEVVIEKMNKLVRYVGKLEQRIQKLELTRQNIQ